MSCAASRSGNHSLDLAMVDHGKFHIPLAEPVCLINCSSVLAAVVCMCPSTGEHTSECLFEEEEEQHTTSVPAARQFSSPVTAAQAQQ